MVEEEQEAAKASNGDDEVEEVAKVLWQFHEVVYRSFDMYVSVVPHTSTTSHANNIYQTLYTVYHVPHTTCQQHTTTEPVYRVPFPYGRIPCTMYHGQVRLSRCLGRLHPNAAQLVHHVLT